MKKKLALFAASLAAASLTLPVWAQDAPPAIDPEPESEKAPPEGAVAEDPVPPGLDPTPLDNVPPPIPVTDPAEKLEVLKKEAAVKMDADLYAALKAYPQFSSFIQLANAAGGQLTLSQGGPFTVFAPTNEAFEALPEGMMMRIIDGQGPATAEAVFQRHLVANILPAKELASGTIEIVGGGELKIETATAGGAVTIGPARVVMVDLVTRNGVVHAVDKVLLPSPAPAATTE